MPGGGGGGDGVGTPGAIANVLLMRPFSRVIVATPPRVPSDTEGAVGTGVSNQSLDAAAASATKAVANAVDNRPSVGRKWQNRILIVILQNTSNRTDTVQPNWRVSKYRSSLTLEHVS